jgi:hypothetical protein
LIGRAAISVAKVLTCLCNAQALAARLHAAAWTAALTWTTAFAVVTARLAGEDEPSILLPLGARESFVAASTAATWTTTPSADAAGFAFTAADSTGQLVADVLTAEAVITSISVTARLVCRTAVDALLAALRPALKHAAEVRLTAAFAAILTFVTAVGAGAGCAFTVALSARATRSDAEIIDAAAIASTGVIGTALRSERPARLTDAALSAERILLGTSIPIAADLPGHAAGLRRVAAVVAHACVWIPRNRAAVVVRGVASVVLSVAAAAVGAGVVVARSAIAVTVPTVVVSGSRVASGAGVLSARSRVGASVVVGAVPTASACRDCA